MAGIGIRRSALGVFVAVLALWAAGISAAPAAPADSVVPAVAADSSQPWMNSQHSPASRAAELLAAMTLADKVNMLHGVDSSLSPVPTVGYLPPIPRLHVPAITMTDGPAGVRNGRKATELPAPISQAASFDTAVATAYGAVEGTDARDLGQDQLFGPGMDIDRNPLNGRNFEYFSEDPLLSGTIAGADVTGVQSAGVVATIKHYLANNQETNRTSISANVDDRTLHEIYQKNFGIAIADGHPGSVMCSYNRINDVYACSNAATLITALRQQFGFDGYVVSDYPATHATTDLANGLNIELPTGVQFTLAAVQAGLAAHQITIADIDQRVLETLTVLFRFGIFDRPLTVAPIDVDADNAVAQHIEEQSAVLLKNDHAVLPVAAGTASVAVIGTTAKTSAQGGGSSQVNPLSVDNAYDAIVSRAGSATSVSYNDGSDPAAAGATARAAQLAVVVVRDSSSEGSDRSTLALSGNQNALIEAVAAANPHTIVVLETGAPALMPWLSQVAGVLEAWYPGARGGAAIARLLWGDVNPSGKLPQTWPATDSQVPASTPEQYPGVGGEETYSEGVDVGYRWYDAHNQTPLFPFGYGLSYTSFSYSQLTVNRAKGTSAQKLQLRVTVRNTGSVAGAEAVQAYVSKPDTLASTPPRELVAFGKVTLAPGQSKTVKLTVLPRELSYWDSGAQAFTVQDGTYTIAVGGSSRSLPVTARYTVRSSTGPVRLAVAPAAGATVQAGQPLTVSGTVSNLSDFPENRLTIAASAPAGWTVRPLTPTRFTLLRPGGTAASRFRITVPAGTAGGTYPVAVTATGTVNGATVTQRKTLTVTVPFGSFATAYNTVGLTNDADPSPGNFDPAGYSYSAQALAAAGITPGGRVTVGGASTTFPAPAPGTPDAVTAAGQVIDVAGSAPQLVIVGAATYGEVSGTVLVRYTDGTSTAVTVDFANWYSNAPTATSSLVATVHWNSASGAAPHDVSIYGQLAAIDAGKTMATITLPNQPNLHFFVIGPAG
ncbi:MAG: glycoside hydrolase family 3 C-terminal domain-containing protein [Nakamurella sp.]